MPDRSGPAPPGHPHRVLVAIVHWNTPDLLAACVAALDDLSRDTVTVLVIDNGSATGLPDGLAARTPAIEVVRLADNPGYAGAAAWATSRVHDGGFDALWLLNADVVACAAAFAAMTAAASDAPDTVIGSVVLDGSGEPRMPEKFLHSDRRWRFGRRDRPVPLAWFDACLRPVQAIHGASMWIPRTVIERHGGFDPAWFLYCEEIDFCLRLRRAGVPVLIAGAARVRHVGGGSMRRQPESDRLLDYYRMRNELLLWRRHAPCWFPWILARKILATLARTIRSPCSVRWRWAGILDGLRGRSGKRHAPEAFWRPN